MIENYLISNCLIVIEDLNQRFERFLKEEIHDFATTKFDESDLVFLLAYPFRNLMKVSMQGKNEDIKIPKLGFIVEVKYLYATKSVAGNYTSKRSFEESFLKDYNWLVNELKMGEKGKRAFVVGWFNTYHSFSNVMQLGSSAGKNPKIDEKKLDYFPFLKIPGYNSNISDIEYNYRPESVQSRPVQIHGIEADIEYIFLGKESDVFHFVIYH